MARKVKKPLDMGNEIYVRRMEELQEHFNLEKVCENYLNGNLLSWLEMRGYDEEYEQLKSLNCDESELPSRLCEVFEQDYDRYQHIDLNAINFRNKRFNQLREITDDENIIERKDFIVYTQNEFELQIKNHVSEIYLFGDKFYISDNCLNTFCIGNVTIIGINNPTIFIDSNQEKIDFDAKDIQFNNLKIDSFSKIAIRIDKSSNINVGKKIKTQILPDEIERVIELDSENPIYDNLKLEAYDYFLYKDKVIVTFQDKLHVKILSENLKNIDFELKQDKYGVEYKIDSNKLVMYSKGGYRDQFLMALNLDSKEIIMDVKLEANSNLKEVSVTKTGVWCLWDKENENYMDDYHVSYFDYEDKEKNNNFNLRKDYYYSTRMNEPRNFYAVDNNFYLYDEGIGIIISSNDTYKYHKIMKLFSNMIVNNNKIIVCSAQNENGVLFNSLLNQSQIGKIDLASGELEIVVTTKFNFIKKTLIKDNKLFVYGYAAHEYGVEIYNIFDFEFVKYIKFDIDESLGDIKIGKMFEKNDIKLNDKLMFIQRGTDKVKLTIYK